MMQFTLPEDDEGFVERFAHRFSRVTFSICLADDPQLAFDITDFQSEAVNLESNLAGPSRSFLELITSQYALYTP